MKKTAKLLNVLMATTMVFSMAACGGGTGNGGGTGSGGNTSNTGDELKLITNANATKTITFEYLKAGFGNDPYIAVANAYMERHPDVQINTFANREIEGQAPLNISTGTSVSDIYSYPRDSNKTWIEEGWLEDLTDLCNQQTLDGRTMLESMTGNAAQAIATADGKIYGVPEYTSVTGVIYNQALFNQYGWEIPETTKEFEELCIKIKEDTNGKVNPITWCKDADGYLYFAAENWISQYAGVENMDKFYALESAEVYATEDNDKGSLYTAKKLALQNLTKFFLTLNEGGYAANNSRETSNTAAQLSLMNGDSAMMLNGSWFYNEMKKYWKDTHQIGMFALPEMSDEQGNVLRASNNTDEKRTMTASYSAYYIIPSNAPQKEVAKDFLLYLSSEEACEIYTQYANTIRPFIYNVGKDTELYSKMTNFGKSVLAMADQYELYSPASLAPVALKGYGALWADGRVESNMMMKKDSETNPDYWLNKDYQYAKSKWEIWLG